MPFIKENQTFRIREVVLIFIATGLSMVAYQIFPVKIDPAHMPVDFPYHWFQNYSWANQLRPVENTHFPHGAFGALQYLWPISGCFYLGVAIVFLQRLLLSFLVFKILKNVRSRWIVLLIALVCLWPLRFADGLVLQAVLLFLVFSRSLDLRWILLLLLTVVFSYYIRLFPLIMSIGLSGAAILLHLYEKRKLWITALVPLPVLGILLVWLFIFPGLDNFGIHNKVVIELFKGSPYATALYPDNNRTLLLLSFGTLGFVLWKVSRLKELIVMMGVWFLTYKYAFVREGFAHMQVYPEIMIATGFLLAVRNNQQLGRNVILLLISLLSFLWNMQLTTGKFWPRTENVYALTSWPYYLNEEKAQVKFIAETKDIVKYHKWPQAAAEVGQASAAVFPFNYLYPILNGGEVAATPITQSYVAYTPWLDSLQADFFKGRQAPPFVYVHEGFGIAGGLSIDYQYYYNVAPLTQSAIQRGYERILSRKEVSLWKKRTGNKKTNTRMISTSPKFNEWVEVPEYRGEEVYFKPELHLNAGGKLRNFFFKPPKVMIVYELSNGDLYQFHLNILNASNGILVQPFYLDHDRQRAVTVKRLQIQCSQPGFFSQP